LNILKDFKVLSRFMRNATQSSYWLAHCYLIKKSTKVALYLDVDCGMMAASRNPKNNRCLSRIMEYGLVKKDYGLSTCKP
jgi:hypothetical protein